MKFTTVSVRQLDRKGKPWQARATYYDVYGKRKEVAKMLPEAKGKREAQKIAKITAVEAMKRLAVKPNTFYRRVKEWGL